MLNSQALRADFPILDQLIHDEPLVYLDNAATTQKTKVVLDALATYYLEDNANVHRGVHTLAERATQAYEAARQKVADFIHSPSSRQVVFTRGTTTSLNYIARFAQEHLTAEDEVLISIMEHHANIIPWQQACQQTGAKLVYVGLKDGQLDMDDLKTKLTQQTKFVSLAHVSNVLGSITPVKEIAALAHAVGAYMVVDAAQSVPHMPVDVQDLDCDFLVFSGHKMLGPTGIGVLYGKEELLELMSPVEFGGDMIEFVYEQEATWKELPWKLEAGTPHIAGAIALGAAVDYLTNLGMEQVEQHEQELVHYLLPRLLEIEGLTLYGPQDPSQHTGVLSFNLEGLHPHDVATALDYEGVAVRAGHHCTQPLARYLGVAATVRASLYLYNTKEDCDKLIEALIKTKEFFHGTF